MTRKKVIKRKNTPLNIFAEGGALGNINLDNTINNLRLDTSKINTLGSGGTSGSLGMQNIANSGGGSFNLGSIGGIGSSIGSIINAGISNSKIADTSGIDANINNQKNMVVRSASSDDLLNEWSSWNKSKDNYSWRDVRGGSTGQRLTNTIGATGQGVATGASVGGPIGAIVGGVVGLGSSIAGWITGNSKAKRKAKRLNTEAMEANDRALTSFETRADNLDTQNDFNILANYSAYGGPLNFNNGAIDYELSNKFLNNQELSNFTKQRITALPNSYQELPNMNMLNTFAEGGKIHIKEKNKGKFTEYCGGKVTSECISRGKNSNNPVTRKRAVFADNARKWHAYGGSLKDDAPIGTLYQGAYNSTTSNPESITNGGIFSNGITSINEGGTHEENPLTGVPIGVDDNGKPNLVEEGEVIFNDYVFSNRLKIKPSLLNTFNIPSKYENHTFASIAEGINKESNERPNDPISKRGLVSSMSKLMQAQEEMKSTNKNKIKGKQFAYGGYTNNDWNPTLLDNNPFTEADFIKAQKESTNPISTQTDSSNPIIGLDALRYAPALGAGVNVMSDLLGWNNKSDYKNTDMILDELEGIPNVESKPIGNYLSYNPLDRDFYINKLNQQASATRRGIINTSGGNRLNAQAGILAADYNYGQQLGDLARKAEEYNQAQKERVETFNRGTNQYNSESAMRADAMNQQNREMKLRAIMQVAGMREDIDKANSIARSTNLSNFFDSLGDIGKEEFSRNMIESNPSLNYTIDRSGRVKYKKPSTKK